MLKKTIIPTLRVLVTITFLVFVVYKAGLFSEQGRSDFIHLIARANMMFILISLLMSFLLNLSSSIKWYMLLKSRNLKVGLGRVLAYYQIGKFYNLILPTSMGGDVVRIYELARYTGRKAETIASVFVERFTGMVMLTVVSMFAVILNLRTYNIPLITGSLLFCIIAVAVIGWLVIDRRPFEFFKSIVNRRVPFLNRIFSKISKVHSAVGDYKENSAALWVALLNSLIFYFLAVVNVWVSALAFDRHVSFNGILIAVPAILLIMNLPISIGGIGLMEFAYTLTFEMIGLSSALGLSTVLLIRAKTFIDAGVGGLVHLLLLKNCEKNMSARVNHIKEQKLSSR